MAQPVSRGQKVTAIAAGAGPESCHNREQQNSGGGRREKADKGAEEVLGGAGLAGLALTLTSWLPGPTLMWTRWSRGEL